MSVALQSDGREVGAGTTPQSVTLHATTVALPPEGNAGGQEARGVIILGPSGSGKSALALRLMALGAVLVADDRSLITRRAGALYAGAPQSIRGVIEARGVGLLKAEALAQARIVLAVDLARHERARLPEHRVWRALGIEMPLLHAVASDHFPAALLQYLRCGRYDQP